MLIANGAQFDSSYRCILVTHIMSRNETQSCNPQLQKSANTCKISTCRSLFACSIKEIGRGCDKSVTMTQSSTANSFKTLGASLF